MYYLQLYSDSHTHIAGLIEVESTLLPRPGDVIEKGDKEEEHYIVFDVTHSLFKGRCMAIVRAREASREGRQQILMENGYLVPQEEPRYGELFVSQTAWGAVESRLPRYRDLQD